ncbi:MAG: hypothetical protein ACI4OI_06280 [Gemmiger sp.]
MRLYTTPGNYIQDITLVLSVDGTVAYTVDTVGEGAVRVEIHDADGAVVAATEGAAINGRLDRCAFVVGEMPWNFADFAAQPGPMRPGGNRKGLFDRTRCPKLAAHYFRGRWAQKGPTTFFESCRRPVSLPTSHINARTVRWRRHRYMSVDGDGF